jgi:Ca-activated chloride channel family protein
MAEASQLALFLAEFHFLRPLWLLALIPALLCVFFLWRLNESASSWDRAIDKDLLPYLLDSSKSVAERTPLVILLALWTLAILALAGPVWEKIAQPVQARQDAMVIVYDQSLSMYATDYEPNRQTVSKRKIMDVLDRRVEGQTALIVYAGDAHAVTPLTEDSVTIRSLVPSINPNMMPAFGSNTIAAVQTARQLFADAGAASGTIFLVTDGVERRDHAELQQMLSQSGVRLVILGVGTDAGATIPAAGGDFLRDANGQIVVARLDRASLQDLAAAVDGRYADMDLTGGDLDYLLEDDGFLDEDELSAVEENFDIWFEAGPWLLVLILPLGAMAFRRGWLLTITLLLGTAGLISPSSQVQAAEWTDLWKTKDQQGADAMAQEDAIGAAALFQSPEWRGTAAYRAGDFAGAVQAYSLDPGTIPDNHYNLGNAYAMTQNFEAAVSAYDIAIAMDPEHTDAIHNREIVAALLEQQQNEEEQQSDDDMTSPQDQTEEQSEEQQEEGEQEEQDQEQQQEQQEEGEEGEEQEQQEQQQGSEQEQQEEQTPGEQPNQSSAETESQESLEQWLRRIDDDPGELMQRKFQFEYRRRQLESRTSPQSTDGQIW